MNEERDAQQPVRRTHESVLVHPDDDRRSRRRERRRQGTSVESRNPNKHGDPSSTTYTTTTAIRDINANQQQQLQPQTRHQSTHLAQQTSEQYKSEIFVMSDRRRKVSDSRQASLSRSPPTEGMRTESRQLSVFTAQPLIPTHWQEPTERLRKRSTGKTSPSVTVPQQDKRHSLTSPTAVPMMGGSNFLMVHPPSELRVQGTPPGGTRAAIHIIDDFLHNPPTRQRSLTRGQGSRGSRTSKEPRSRRTSRTQCTVGLDHLDNLCRLMEQLSSLREENTKLKRRCAFLENTRELLKIQNQMLINEREEFESGEEEDTLSLGLSESTLAESQIMDDDDVFSHSKPQAIPRSAHRRSQSVGSLDMMDVLPALAKQQHSYRSPFTSKFKKSFKITRNTIKKVFGRKEDVVYTMVKSPVPRITTTPQEERIIKLSQSSNRSSRSPSQSETSPGYDQPSEVASEILVMSDFETPTHHEQPLVREVVSDDATTPDLSSSPLVRRRYNRPITDVQLLTRRRSSPTLTVAKDEATEYKRPNTPEIPRSVTTPQFSDYSPKDDKIRGRTAWGKVKDIIHTRKDSLKRRTRKSTEENRRSMTDAILDRKSAEPRDVSIKPEEETLKASSSDTKLDKMAERTEMITTNKTAQFKGKALADMEGAQTAEALKELVGNLSDEFNRKMMEWERKKNEGKLGSGRVSSGSVGDGISRLGKESEKRPERKISHTAVKSFKSGDSAKDTAHQQATLESLQKGMSDSFNRKMLEWERMRSGQTQDGYMSVEGLKRDVPWKSRSEKKTKAEKEKVRMERMREKELMKLGREQQKLERDRARLQREHQRTMRRALELDRKKEQLEDFGMVVDSGYIRKGHAPLSYQQSYPYDSPRRRHYKFVNVGEYKIEGVSQEFAKRLQTWEEKRHKTKECFHVWDPHDRQHSRQHTDVGDIVIPPKFQEGQPPLPILIRSHQGMTEHLENIHTSPQIVRVEPTYQRATLCTHETQTSPQGTIGLKTNKQFHFDDPIVDLRNRNLYLSHQLRQKENESQSLSDDVEGLNRALRRMNESYTKEIASYKHQLWASSHWGQMSEQSKFVAEAVNELRIRVEQLEDMHCMEARRRPFSGDNSKTDSSKSSTATAHDSNPPGQYKNLVDYVKKLHAQISDLKKGVVERDDVLNKFRKHLSLEEINKLLLNADIQRRDLELQFFKKKHKHGVIRRHCTFGGTDFCIRQGCGESDAFKTWPKYRARCVDKLPTTFKYGNFDPDSAQKDSDIADVLRTCGINSEDSAGDKHQDILNGNLAATPPRRRFTTQYIQTRTVGTQFEYQPADYLYGDREHQWSPTEPRHYSRGITIRRAGDRPRPDSDRSDSDSERRSRIDYGRRNLREAFFSSVTDTLMSQAPTSHSNEGSLSPTYRPPKSPNEGTKTSFKVRSATYFSPKPYIKSQQYHDDGHSEPLRQAQQQQHQQQRYQQDFARRLGREIGPLRKLHSASELMTERRTLIAGRFAATEVRHSSLMDRSKTREDLYGDVSLRRSQLLLQQEPTMSQSNIQSGIDVQSMAQVYDQPQDGSEGSSQLVPAKELPQEGTVRRLTEVFVSGFEINGQSTRSKYASERMSEAMQRKLSMEIPKEGTVQKRLEEFIPLQAKSDTSPPQRKKQSEIPKEGTVQKRLEELKLYSCDTDRLGPDGKESRKSDSDDGHMQQPGRKETMSSTEEEYGSSKGHSEDEAFAEQSSGRKLSHTSINLRPQPIGQHRDRTRRLSPMEMLVRGTVSLNLDVVSPGYSEDTHTQDEPPLSPGGSDRTKRRSWFARSFFKSQK